MPSGLSHTTWRRTLQVHDAALADSTRENYARAIARFREWEAAERLPARPLPISEPLLCAYAASYAGLRFMGAARGAMAGLRYAHDKEGLKWLGSPRLARILDAVGRLAPATASRAPRPPVTLAMLDEALTKLDPERGFDQCVAAAMLFVFWGQLRLGEALSPTRRYNFKKLPAGKHVALRHNAGGPVHQATSALWLPATKTARRGEYVWLARHHNDPSYALQEHMADNRIGRNDPLFAYHDDNDVLIPLTKNAFLRRLNEIWAAAGMQSVSGHCFRIGGTTALLKLRVDTDVVKVCGRWKSDAFLRYWRSVDSIIAAHTDLCDIYWSGDS